MRFDDLLEPPSRARPPRVLYKLADKPINADVRLATFRIAGLAREFAFLLSEREQESRSQQLRRRFTPDPTLGNAGEEHEEGIRLATELRKQLRLGTRPIPSMRTLLRREFPEIWVSYARPPLEISGLALVDPDIVPTIAVNLGGRNENVWTLRFHLAHELCHVLFDRGNDLRGVFLDRFELATNLVEAREKRANAFAAHFLAPHEGMRSLREQFKAATLDHFTREAMVHFGMHFQAMKLHLRHVAIASQEEVEAVQVEDYLPDEGWIKQERPEDVLQFLWKEVPEERRGEFARTALQSWRAGKITTSRTRELLGAGSGRDIDALASTLLDSPVQETIAQP